MVAHAFGTFGAIFLATVFFTVPLVIKYHVFKPQTQHLATGDVVYVQEGISTVWCQAVEISTDPPSTFQSFLYQSEPRVNEGDFQRSVVSQHMTLPNKAQKYWGFHLLRGSLVNISSCVRLYGGDLTIVKGYKALRRCLAEHRYFHEVGDDSREDSLSESESDDVTSSISSSQGAPSNETDHMYKCRDALHHVHLPSTYVCRKSGRKSARKSTLQHHIEETAQYYYIFSSDTYLDIIPNEFSVEFVFDRTHYDYTTSSSNCSSSDYCQLDITLASEEKIVVQMDGMNGPLKVENLSVACKPREWIFCIFYVGFFIVIFLCAFQ